MPKKWVATLGIGLAGAAAAFALWHAGWLNRWEAATWAWRVRALARPGTATSQIKVILLDQASLDWGRREMKLSWPWPREVYVPLLDFCARAGARAVAFDVLFLEPSYLGVEDDERLAEAVARSRAVAGAIYLGEGDARAWPGTAPDPGWEVVGLDGWLARAPAGFHAASAAFPIPELAARCDVLGNVNEAPDEDGVFRRWRPFQVFDGRWVPSLALATHLVAERSRESGEATLALSPGGLRVGSRNVPLDAAGRAILRYRGPSGTHAAYSAAAVIQSELRLQSGEVAPSVDPAVFRDAYVFFGFSAPGLMDLRSTPVHQAGRADEIHATALDNLLSGDFLRDPPPGVVAAGLALLALACAAATVAGRRAWHSGAAFVVGLALPFAAGFAAYDRGWTWPVAAGALADLLALTGGLLYNYSTEGRQKAFLKQAFRHYLSPVVIERLLEDPAQLRLGGERRELTIFFSDLQGFSSLSERLDPEALTQLLNDYLTDMTDIILEEGGTLDKYEGDAIIAFWNAPVGQPDHATRAVRAALWCQRRLADRRAEFRERSGVDLRMRIGIHTGEVVVGNMGSRERFDYTVLGDAANLASRLEGANKAFGTFLMVSETTWAAARGFAGRELARLRVVGRQTPVRVFEPCEGAPPPGWTEFARGLEAFGAGRFSEALAAFERAGDDPAARAYAQRCRRLAAEPPPEWDGVWNLTEK